MARSSQTSRSVGGRSATPRAGAAQAGAARKTATKRAPAKKSARQQVSASRRSSAPSNSPRAQAEQVGAEVQERARATTREQLSVRSNQAGDQLAGVVSDVRDIAQHLRSQDNESAANLAGTAADRMEQVADYLSNSSADTLLRDLEDFARSRPWAVAVGAVAAGFAASRALSSSSRRRHGGSALNLDAGSEFDEDDAESDYDAEPGR